MIAAKASVGSGNRQTTRAARAIHGWPETAKILRVSTSLEDRAPARGRIIGIGMTVLSPDPSESQTGGAARTPVFTAKTRSNRRKFKSNWLGIAVGRAYPCYTLSLGRAARPNRRFRASDMPESANGAVRTSQGIFRSLYWRYAKYAQHIKVYPSCLDGNASAKQPIGR